MEIYRVALGETHPSFANGLINLANMYQLMKDYASAEPLCRQAMEIYRVGLGDEHPSFARSLNTLAVLHKSMGYYVSAERLCRQAMEIRRAALGEEHPDFARSLNNLGELYRLIGNYAEAEPFYRQAMKIYRLALGEAHPSFANSLNNLALLCAATGRASEALSLMRHAASIDDRMIGQVFSVSSESQRTAFLRTARAGLDAFLSLVRQHFAEDLPAIEAALGIVLRRKAVLAEAVRTQRDALLGGKYPELQGQLHQLTILRTQIGQKSIAGPGPEGLDEYQRLLDEWNHEKERLEADLARQIPEMNMEARLRAADRRVVALKLPEGVALVEFVRFNVLDFEAVAVQVSETEWKPPRPGKPARYLAFVLTRDKQSQIRMIDLGEALEIDQMIRDFRKGVSCQPPDDAERNRGWQAHEASVWQTGCDLRATLFPGQLNKDLRRFRRLLIAPDGELNHLPFELLPIDNGRRMIDEYHLSYLSVGRDVLRFGAACTGQPGPAVVAADPDFDLGMGGAESEAPETACFAGRRSRDVDRSLGRFRRLPGTREEGALIARLLNVEPTLEGSVLESRIKSCKSPWILHIATHGFFFEDQEIDPEKLGRGMELVGSETLSQGPFPFAGRLENPLLRSGLALAGANWRAKGFRPPPAAEDGLLTAEDVTGMDLLATELVVLSACETGRGEIQVGEGVFGLRRSFALAGAKTLVMSLWNVPDRHTRELMEEFYGRILAGEPRAEALRQAQLTMKAKYPHPYYWGAFICQGDPSPLSGAPK
jgi:hypothetical protein